MIARMNLENFNCANGIRRCNENPTISSGIRRQPPALLPTFRTVYRVRVADISIQRSCFDVSRRDTRFNREWHSWVRARHRPPIIGIAVFLAGPYPAGKNRRKESASTDSGRFKCLCLLSLCFGGLLWPIAWLWAYTKPVLHKMAYGTDVDESHGQTGRKKSSHE